MSESEGRARRVNVSSLLAGCLAVLALSVSLWQGYEERRHNRLSVRPLLTFDYTYDTAGWFSLEVVNTGVGPAIIQRFEAFVDGQPVSNGGAIWAEVMSHLSEDVELMHSYDSSPGTGSRPGHASSSSG